MMELESTKIIPELVEFAIQILRVTREESSKFKISEPLGKKIFENILRFLWDCLDKSKNVRRKFIQLDSISFYEYYNYFHAHMCPEQI